MLFFSIRKRIGVHIRHPGDWDEIVFRDYLRRNPRKADEYAELKKKLQKRFEHDRDAYTEAKGEFLRACVKAARGITMTPPRILHENQR